MRPGRILVTQSAPALLAVLARNTDLPDDACVWDPCADPHEIACAFGCCPDSGWG